MTGRQNRPSLYVACLPSNLTSIARRVVPHAVYRRYRRRKIAHQVSQFDARDVTHEYAGHRLTVRLADPLGAGWYDRDWEEPSSIAFPRELGVLRAGARVFDIGAHQAVVAMIIARIVGDAGSVVAVEAEPHNARVAHVNRELNAAGNLVVVHAAGGATPGFTTFAEGLNGHVDEATSAGNVTVPTVTVDQLAADHGTPDLVFIDVEGYEGKVLEGARETLANGSSSFFVEVHETLGDFGGSPAELLQRFAGFDTYTARGDDDTFAALEGPPPEGRFFLVAVPSGRPSA